ncbi:MAG: hypothetical protein P1V97_14690 [Planctomycetota bacterium]|nr:hypothetical protein [Planctomycetota bacterium]
MNEEEVIAAALKLPKDAQLRFSEALLEDNETSTLDSDEQKAALVKLIKARKKAYQEGHSGSKSPEELLNYLREKNRGRKQQSATH